MSRPEWILCERSNDWLAALLKALQRSGSLTATPPRLREVRNLSDAAAKLDARPGSFVLIEVHRGNFADVLSFLSDAVRRFSHRRIAALVDAELTHPQHATTKPPTADRLMVADILLEAGAADVVNSPRSLDGLLDLAQRHAATWTTLADSLTAECSVAERAWASLPWQDK